jgi:hypothetical protein
MTQNRNSGRDSELYPKTKVNEVMGEQPSNTTVSMSVKETEVKHFKVKKSFVKLIVIAVALTGIFGACKKDDDDDKNKETPTIPIVDNPVDPVDIFAFTAEEQQRISTIKTMYSSIQTSFSGGYFITVPTINPYTTGEVKTEVLQAGIDAINTVRYIAGVPHDVELDAGYTDLCQHGVVLLTAINQLSHYPAKPDDMDQEFYDKASQATSNSNIATANLPSFTVLSLYMDDSDPNNIPRVGHRRWILNPPMKKSGFGVGATKYGVMYAFDKSRGNVDYDYVTWPSKGVFPIELVNSNLAWSISVNAQKYGTPDISKVAVTLKHLNSGQVWTFSDTTITSTARQKTYFTIETTYRGINNCIIFRPALDNSFKYKEGDLFEVTISGLDQELTYRVKMFSMKKDIVMRKIVPKSLG